MIISATIFNNILFGDLAPWRPENTIESKFRDILNNQVRVYKDNPVKYFNALSNALKDYHVKLDIDHLPNDEAIANLAKHANLQTYASSPAISPYFNKASEFYQYLINNENIRICAALATKVSKAETDIDSEYQVSGILRNLENVIEHIAEKTHNDKLSSYVLNAVKITLFRLYEEIKLSFPDFIGTDSLSVYEVINLIAPDFESQKNIENSVSFVINQFLLARQVVKAKEVNLSIAKHDDETPPPVNVTYHSFTYKFKNKNQEYIRELFDSLKSNNFIEKSTGYTDFRKIFSGDPVTNRVIWSGKISELHYFIELISKKDKSISDLKQHHWEVACKCFIWPDGSEIDRAKLKEQKNPKLTANLIEKGVNHLL